MKTIYFSHPYGGKAKNVQLAAEKLNALHKMNPGICYVSPLHALAFIQYNDGNYSKGLSYCLALLKICDEILVGSREWEDSKGCCAEVAYAYAEGIPVKFV